MAASSSFDWLKQHTDPIAFQDAPEVHSPFQSVDDLASSVGLLDQSS